MIGQSCWVLYRLISDNRRIVRYDLLVMIVNTISSVAHIASLPILVRLRIEQSTSWSIIPSASVTCLPSRANRAESNAVETPEQIFNEQLGFAPSQIIPVKLAIIFFTEWQISAYCPPMR